MTAVDRRSDLLVPDLRSLVEHLRGSSVVHLHTGTPDPWTQLAAQLAGPELIVETVHDELARADYEFADATVFLSQRALAGADAPARAHRGTPAVELPEGLPDRAPWFVTGDAPTLVEVRVPGRSQAFTLDELFARPPLRDLLLRGVVVGAPHSNDPRITCVGADEDPRPWLRDADFLVCGASHSSSGRRLLEALAQGVPPIATPLDNFRALVPGDRCARYFTSLSVESSAAELRRLLDDFEANPEDYRRLRDEGRLLVRRAHSPERLSREVAELYERELADPPRRARNFSPADVSADDLPQLSEVLAAHDAADPVAACDDLPPRARGVAYWYLAHFEHVPDEERPRLLTASHDLLGPRHVVCHDLGREWKALGEYEKAVDWLRRAVDADPARVSSYLEWVDAELTCGHVAEGLAVLERLCDRVPEFEPGRDMVESLLAGPAPRAMRTVTS